MTGVVRCPVCEAKGLFSRRLGEHSLYRCASCESLFYYPSPLAHARDETPWESAKWYAERGANLLFYAEILAHIRSFVETLSSRKRPETIDMLEVGGSYGFLMDMASVLFRWSVSGIDPSPCAQQGARELGRETVFSRLEDARPDKKFDVIVGVQVIEHIQEPRAFMGSMSHLVKEDGLVILTTPDASVDDLGAEYSPGEHHILFSQKGLAPLLADIGLIHHRFFTTTVPTIMGVAAAKNLLPALRNTSTSLLNESADSKQMALEYLLKRVLSGSHTGPLGIGLYFRLFELLVNRGCYADADAHVRTFETLMGMEQRESPNSFMARLFNTMISATTAQDYVTAGPGCFAPYLFYKGIMNLNYRRDRGAAAECFKYAARLLEHEVQGLGLVQYLPLLKAARSHMEMTGGKIESDTNDIYKETRKVEAAPFIKGGIFEFCRSVPIGRLLRLGIKGGNSFIFTFTSMEDNLSGVSFDLLVRPYSKRDPVDLTLHLFEEYNPVALRETRRIIEFGSRTKLQRTTEPFRFEPIRDSRGKTYSVVLALGKDTKRAGLLCSNLKGTLTVAGYRQYRNVQPVMIPYHHIAARFRKLSQDEAPPLISCLIVTFNSEGYIRHCLNSIAEQDYPNIEVVVIDNHSNDRTVETIRKEFSHVNLFVMDQNLEFCKGNNFGLSKCKGEFICVLNADVVLEQGALRRFLEHMEISPQIAIVGSAIETKGSRTRYADTFIIDGVISNDEKLLAGERFSSAPCGAGFMIRRSVVDDLGYLFDEGFISNWEDHDLGLRCWLRGHIVLHIPDLGLYHYGGSAHGLADPQREAQVFRNMLLTYFKNFGKRLFIKAFLKTLTACTRPYRILGVMRFLGCFWKYIPERAALQRKRKIDDLTLQVVTSGVLAVIPEDEKEVRL
ncbi:MAG TPA: glycosyltransferase [Thermodesulfovibrionales bacterium]|nr:glycosyltransferase [Thermodesulfovibrionales bacterium]